MRADGGGVTMRKRKPARMRRWVVMGAVAGMVGVLWMGCEETMEQAARENREAAMAQEQDGEEKVSLTEEEWRKRLTPEQYRVLRQAGTERPFSSPYWNSESEGVYVCAGCGQELFRSDAKFNSSCGWPSYFEPVEEGRLIYRPDHSLGMVRTEILCSRCGGHIGHVFDDGPPPTGKRYCVNGVAVKLESEEQEP